MKDIQHPYPSLGELNRSIKNFLEGILFTDAVFKTISLPEPFSIASCKVRTGCMIPTETIGHDTLLFI
jgi:hypothetical protein